MKITRRFTSPGIDPFSSVTYEKRTSRISNPDGSVVFEMNDAEIPAGWSQLATDIMVSKYFRKAGVPQKDDAGQPMRDARGQIVTGPERSAKEVIHRLAGCWRYWGEKFGYFDSAEDGQAFYDELAYMLLHQMCAPNSPQWFNTGLNFAYGITGPAQGHWYCDPKTGELSKSRDAYSHPQPHACQPFHAPVSTPRGPVPIGKIVMQKLVGLEVLDGTDGGNGTTHIVAVKSNGFKEVFRVVLEDGSAIEATADHLIYAMASDGLSGRWVRLDSLERGAILVKSVRDRQPASPPSSPASAIAAAHEAESDSVAAPPFAESTEVRTLRQVAVKRIDRVSAQEVFDIQTESGQYLSNYILIHNCFIQSVSDDLVNSGGIMDLWTREARLFKYGSGTGSNFSKIRGENEPLSGGGKSSGLMSFLKIGDRAAGAIKSGGTTRRAAKMVCLDLDHPDVEQFINWKVREELKVAALAEGMKHLSKDQRETAKRLGLKLDYDFNGEAYLTVSGQNSNNSVRIPNRFFKAVQENGEWILTSRTTGKVTKSARAAELWDQVAYAAWRCADPGVQYDDTINQWHTCPRSGRINASNPCVTGDTRVLTPDGVWRRIDQMIHIPGGVVTAKDGHETHFSDGAFPTGTRDVYELRTVGGYRLTLTADHRVWTRNRGWVAAENLRESDQIKLPSEPACADDIGEPNDAKFFQLLGLYVSSANGNLGSVNVEQCLADRRFRDAMSRYVTSGSERVYADDYVDPAMLITESTDIGGSGGTMTASFTSRRLLSRLRAFVRCDNGRPGLADEAFTAGLAAQKHLLRALFTAEGSVDGGTLSLHSASQGLLEDVQVLLLGFGIQSALSIVEAASSSLLVAGSGNADVPVGSSGKADGDVGVPRFGDLASGEDAASTKKHDGGGASVCGELPDRRRGTLHSDARSPGRGDAAIRRHGLRIDSGSLRSFIHYIGFLPGTPLAAASARLADADDAPDHAFRISGNFDRVASLTPAGRQQVFDLTEPVTSSFVANGLVVHNCSEYMFLDDTACNLASLNVLTFFDAEDRHFDVEGFKHGIRLWTMVLEISVLMASFPSEAIAELSYTFRTLGLGYANLGAMLMQAGIAYDSPKGRAICGAVTALLTGESYATSAEMADELGAFAGFDQNRSDMLRVIRNHRRAAYDVANNAAAAKALGQYESLDIEPVGIDESQFADNDPMTPRSMLFAARDCWDRALAMGERHGYRNAQTTVIAPTGTIGLLMDCDTTGVEPDFALVKFKKLAGGGYFKIANQSLPPALACLGYEPHQIHDILQYVMGTLTLHGAPHLGYEKLQSLGFTPEELEKIEAALPGVFEISFAFSPWSLGKAVFDRLEIPEAEWQAPNFNLLRRLGFSRRQIDEANDWVCGRGTIEGAPSLKDEHLTVFDCANKCGRHGQRYIAVEGHIRMMAAAQPFISGAISKTINLPNEATVEDIKNSYFLSWQLGLKANALYRDGSKLSQPLNSKSDEDTTDSEEEDEEAVAAAREEVAHDVARVAASIADSPASAPVSSTAIARSDNLAPTHHSIERIVERIVERPLRRRLPDTRRAITHKFDVAGHEGYITVGLYEDGQPGEVFIRIAKEGSTIGGLMDTIATLVSVSLQYGVPVESLVRKFEHVRFEPSGMTRNPEIPIAKSLTDYIFRWMAMEFVPGYRSAHAPKRTPKPVTSAPALPSQPVAEAPVPSSDPGESSSLAPGFDEPPAALPPAPKKKEGNGHGPRFNVDEAKPITYTEGDEELRASHSAHLQAPEIGTPTPSAAALRLAIVVDPQSQQSSELQADAPACDVCGSITVRSGTCYKCLNCGNSMGCS